LWSALQLSTWNRPWPKFIRRLESYGPILQFLFTAELESEFRELLRRNIRLEVEARSRGTILVVYW